MTAFPRLATIVLFVASGTAAQAQSNTGNTLFVEQSGLYNQLLTDQSLATGSTFGTRDSRITQTGDSNRLEITDRGTGNTVATARQDNTVDGIAAPGTRNTAAILLDGTASNAQISLTQTVTATSLLGNDATIRLLNGSAGSITQTGGNNTADLTVNGLGASGSIEQIGDRNNGTLTVTDANVSLSQQGSDLVDIISGSDLGGLPAGITVTSNGATVNIVQTSNLPASR